MSRHSFSKRIKLIMTPIITLGVLFYLTFPAHAVYLTNLPQELKQPNGEIIHCLASGDEFFNFGHTKTPAIAEVSFDIQT